MFFVRENMGKSHRSKWMITGGTPISGNLHMACLIVVDLPLLLWPVFIGFPPRLWPVFDWQEKRDNDDEHDEPLESGATYSQKTAQSVTH